MIRELRLVNVKSYRDQLIRFEEGVNAIIGENGAGKTTILEAIGFAVFNTLPYNISDFVRRGEKRAEIRVKVVNPKDERLYEIVRRIEGGRTVEYFVRDAETGMRVEGAEGVVGVGEWVKDAFGFEVDLKTVFENAIGVAQGKITSQFLEQASIRDRIFSPLIGVEGYKKAFERSREYERFVEDRLKETEKEIALLQKDVENLGKLKSKLEALKRDRNAILTRISKIDERLSPLEKKLSEVEESFKRLNELRVEEARISSELENLKSNIESLRKEIERIENAERELESLRDIYDRYVKAEGELEKVEREKENVERRLEDLRSKEIRLERLRTRLEDLERRLEEIRRCERELEEVEPLAKREEELMSLLREMEIAERRMTPLKNEIERLEKDLSRLKGELEVIEEESKRLREIEEWLGRVPSDIEAKRDEVMQKIARLNQMLNVELKQFERIKSGKCPILGVECDRIAEVAKAKEKKISKIRLAIEEFERKLERLNAICKKRRKLEEEAKVLRAKIGEKEGIEREVKQKEEILDALLRELEELRALLERKDEVEKEYEGVRGSVERRITLLDKVSKKDEVIREIEETRDEISRISEELGEFEVLKVEYEKLRRRSEELREIIRTCRDGYDRFVKLRGEVERKEEIKSTLESLEAKRDTMERRLKDLMEEIKGLSEFCNEDEYRRMRETIQELRDEKARLLGELTKIENQIEEIGKEIEECESKRRSLENRRELKRKLEKKLRFIRDLREVFKRAIPEITKAYVEAVSVEANRIFCEIMGDYNWELRWTEDFGIRAKYMGKDIDFAQMSGGEQICAALSVRLALLKVLSNVRIVFFDEPTQNMDETRRRNFASQLSKIEGFKQIFVISHDDTFEEMVEHAVKVRKENGVSVIEV